MYQIGIKSIKLIPKASNGYTNLDQFDTFKITATLRGKKKCERIILIEQKILSNPFDEKSFFIEKYFYFKKFREMK